MSLAFLFPGQGSQSVGMGAELADAFSAAREVFQEVDDALGQKLANLMREGPDDQLTLTENAQPALMAVSLAVARTLEKEFGVSVARAAFVAGHSLGEYSALAAAGAISLAASRIRRLARFRSTAPPMRRVAVKPIRTRTSPSSRRRPCVTSAPFGMTWPFAAARKSGRFLRRSIVVEDVSLGRQALTAARATARNDLAAVLGRHARAEAVTALAHEPGGLICALHEAAPVRVSGRK